MGRPLV
jgi:hypothetical protein